MDKSFEGHVQTWEKLGQDDPLWAVATRADKRGGKWDTAEFLETGVRDVRRYRAIFAKLKELPDQFQQVLDFGCGVGRLSLAWAPYAQAVTGIDVSLPMIEKARELARSQPKVQFVHNASTNLSVLPANTFDLVFSNQCLQHIRWEYMRDYLAEFARVCQPKGWVVFQLPAREYDSAGTRWAKRRKAIVDHLPLGLGPIYRRWRHGTEATFEMHYIPVTEVLAVAGHAGLTEWHLESDLLAGSYEGFIYVFRKG